MHGEGYGAVSFGPHAWRWKAVWPSVSVLALWGAWTQEAVHSFIHLCHRGRKVEAPFPGYRWFLSSIPSLISLVSQQVFNKHPARTSFVEMKKSSEGGKEILG